MTAESETVDGWMGAAVGGDERAANARVCALQLEVSRFAVLTEIERNRKVLLQKCVLTGVYARLP